MDVMMQLPVAFVNELRDIRIKQMQDQKEQMEREMASKQAKAHNTPVPGVKPSPMLPVYGTGSLEDVIDEFT